MTSARVGVSPLQALTLGLAAARLTQLVVDDEITRPLRETIKDKADTDTEIDFRVRGAWDLVDTIVNCHACTSIWAAGGVLTAERGGPVGRFLVRVLAFSQAALAVKSVIERIDR